MYGNPRLGSATLVFAFAISAALWLCLAGEAGHAAAVAIGEVESPTTQPSVGASDTWRFSVDTAIAAGAVLVSLLGWVSSYWFSVRAQRRAFRDKLLFEGGAQIIRAVEDYRDWLFRVDLCVAGLHVEADQEEDRLTLLPQTLERTAPELLPNQWAEEIAKFREVVYSDDANAWLLTLEHHRILFPEIAELTERLCRMAGTVSDSLQDCLGCLWMPPIGMSRGGVNRWRKRALRRYEALRPLQIEMTGLTRDLMIYFRNRTVGPISGNQLPERQPLDPSVPVGMRIETDKHAGLRIVNRDEAVLATVPDPIREILALEKQLADLKERRPNTTDDESAENDLREEIRLASKRASFIFALSVEQLTELEIARYEGQCDTANGEAEPPG